MKHTAICVVFGAILLCGESVTAWGGLFNRFSPEMLANLGYGGSHGGGMHPYYQVNILNKYTYGTHAREVKDIFC